MVDIIIETFSGGLSSGASTAVIFVIATILVAVVIFTFMAVNALVAVYAERKIWAFVQDRLGPMGQGVGFHAGKWGLLQTLADAAKLLMKEDIIPASADRRLFILAPFILFIGAFLAFVALPFNQHLIAADFNIGLLYIVAVSSLGVVGIILAGYGSNNKWSLYGAMRSAAQIVSYEIPVGLSLLSVVMLVGSLQMQDIIRAQSGTIWGFAPNWYLFSNPFTFFAFLVYFFSGVAEVNRTPFDMPEAESELVAGFHTEYSGMRWAFFFLAEYANMFIVAGIASVVFLGGWQSPFYGAMDGAAWGLFWFLAKVVVLMFVMIWFRCTFPRLRVDQLMNLCWKVFIPFAFFNILGVGLWDLFVK